MPVLHCMLNNISCKNKNTRIKTDLKQSKAYHNVTISTFSIQPDDRYKRTASAHFTKIRINLIDQTMTNWKNKCELLLIEN